MEPQERTVFYVAVMNDGAKRTRHWGWYRRFEDAEKAVLENHTDIFECGYYTHAVIEEVPEGVMSVAKDAWFFKAAYPTGPVSTAPKVERVPTPPWAEGLFNFTFG